MARKKTKKRPRRRTRKKVEKEKDINEIIEERMEHFAEEISKLGESWEKRGREWEKKSKGWEHGYEHYHEHWRKPFGIVGPFIGSIIGIIFLSLIIWLIALINAQIGSVFLSNIHSFLLGNLGLLFLISLFFSYTSYFSKWHRKSYTPFSPITTAAGVVIILWLLVQMIDIVSASVWMPGITEILSSMRGFIDQYLYSVFWVVIVIGYIILAIKISTGTLEFSYNGVYSDYMAKKKRGRTARSRKFRKSKTVTKVRRLYRSGKDKILGGVCGGIGEYLNVDPVIIRLLWVLIALAWGAGILLYIIAWIVMPRNPKHKW